MNKMILVTGANGHFGKAAIDFLLKKIPAHQIVGMVRDEDKAVGDLREKGIDVRKGDYHDYDSLIKAFQGIEKLLFVSSNDLKDRAKQHSNVVSAAEEAGVKHIFYTSAPLKSVAHTAVPLVLESHLATVRRIKETELIYTLLDNNLYADLVPLFLGEKVLETGVYFPAGAGKAAFAARSEMAEATANVLTGEGHENREYSISSETAHSFAEIADFLSELTGKKIAYIDPPNDVYVEQLKQAQVPQEFIDLMATFAQAIKNGEFDLPDDTLEKLLGRKPMALKDFLKSVYSSQSESRIGASS